MAVTKEEVTKALLHDIGVLMAKLKTVREQAKVKGIEFSAVGWVIRERTEKVEKQYQRPEVAKVLSDMHEKELFRVYPALFKLSGIEARYFSGAGEVSFYEDMAGADATLDQNKFSLLFRGETYGGEQSQIYLVFGMERNWSRAS